MHAANLATGVFIMMSCIYFFDWELYGQVSLIIALSLLATQIIVLGNPSLMVAALTNSDTKYHDLIFRSFSRNLLKPYIVVLTILLTLTICVNFSSFDFFSNLSTHGLVAITSCILLSPFNKLIMSSLTLPSNYSRFVCMTFVRNLALVSFLIISILLDSRTGILYLIALTELVMFPTLLMSRKLMNASQASINPMFLDKIKKNEKTSAFFVTLYFELLGKYDFYIFSFVMSPEIFGAYALISNVNESIQTYLGTVRTQVTPYFSKIKETNMKDLSRTIFLVKFILTALIGLGFIFIYLVFSSGDQKIESWPIYFALLLTATVVMFKSLVYGNVYVQRGGATQLARIGAVHLGALAISFSIVCFYFGFIPALVSSIFLNYMFSWFIFRGIPHAGKVR